VLLEDAALLEMVAHARKVSGVQGGIGGMLYYYEAVKTPLAGKAACRHPWRVLTQVTVSQIFRLEVPGNVSKVAEVDPDRVLVEAAHAAAEGGQLAVGEAVRSLGALLVPLVELQRF